MASAFQRASMAAESMRRKVVALAAFQHDSPDPSPTTWTAWAKAAAGRPAAATAPAMTTALILFMAQPRSWIPPV